MHDTPPIRSYALRQAKMTEAQRRAYEHLWVKYGLSAAQGLTGFQRAIPDGTAVTVEIGFGRGDTLLSAAKACPENYFIGIEAHKPSVGSLLLRIHRENISNIYVYHDDVRKVFVQAIAHQRLDAINIFFPDPWPKRRHHKRRLIQKDFVNLLAQKLKPHGTLHLATDWQDYADHMLMVMTQEPLFNNAAGAAHYIPRPAHRLLTKYEQRGLQLGHTVRDLLFIRQ